MSKAITWDDLLHHPFIKASQDATLIKGIYNTCDQWCMYCPATARCLAYRCRPGNADSEKASDIYGNIADRMFESMELLRNLHGAERRVIPELEAMLDEDPRKNPPVLERMDDPLERMARRYAQISSRYLASHPAKSIVRPGLDEPAVG
jgi:hypothetical protein